MGNTFKIMGFCTLGLTLAACSNTPIQPILDGPPNAQFQSDLAACRQVSLQREASNSGAIGGAILGGLVGGLEADAGDELGDAAIGAAIGGAFGSAEERAQTQDDRDAIVLNCLRGRGHKVVG